jgi:hypothetical protein
MIRLPFVFLMQVLPSACIPCDASNCSERVIGSCWLLYLSAEQCKGSAAGSVVDPLVVVLFWVRLWLSIFYIELWQNMRGQDCGVCSLALRVGMSCVCCFVCCVLALCLLLAFWLHTCSTLGVVYASPVFDTLWVAFKRRVSGMGVWCELCTIRKAHCC